MLSFVVSLRHVNHITPINRRGKPLRRAVRQLILDLFLRAFKRLVERRVDSQTFPEMVLIRESRCGHLLSERFCENGFLLQEAVELSLGVRLGVILAHLVRPASFDSVRQSGVPGLLAAELSQVFC